MRTLKACLMASVAIAAFGMAEQANAQTFVYGGGATFPSKVYRQMMDCVMFPVDGNVAGAGVVDSGQTDNGLKLSQLPIAPDCGGPAGDTSGFQAMMLYSPVGSGGGKRALSFHDGSISGSTGLGIPAAANTIPYVSQYTPTPGAYGYPTIHFAGSDDVVAPADIQAYSGSASNPVNPNYGYWLQIPALAGSVTVAYQGKDGNGNPLNLATGQLNLSRKALCGIVSGHITKWDNAILTADNGGTTLGTGNITFVHRSDKSGTNYLFTNALAAQCVGVFGPTSETNPANALYSLPWTDALIPASQCPAVPVEGSNLVNWPDVGNDQCGTAVPNSGGGHFANGSGNAGVVAQVHAINGSIGYATPDFVDPVVAIGPNPADGLATAAIQNQYDIDNGTGLFQKPSYQKAQIAMSTAIPLLDDTSRANPLNWSRQMIQPNPVLQDAYPIVGFTMLNLYQCYADANVYQVLLTYLTYHYTRDEAKSILHAQQFAEIPDAWLSQVLSLLNPNAPTGFNIAGQNSCSSRSGA